jgi:plasmid stabilization system protein ParE
VQFAPSAVKDIAAIRAFVKAYNGPEKARQVIREILIEAMKLGNDNYHRLGEEIDGFDGPPAREVHKNIVLDGRFEHHYEVFPPFSEVPAQIVILRVWDTRQDR